MRNHIQKYSVALLLAMVTLAPAVRADYHPIPSPHKLLLRAASAGGAELQSVLAKGVDINITDEERETALMEAADDGNLRAVQNLIAAGADVNLRNEDAETALMMAADEGYTEIVKALIAAGAEPNAVDEDGETALQKAIHEGHRATADALRAAGAR